MSKFYQGCKFIDLFAGIGAFNVALTELGAECVFASEIDKKAASVYEKNHGHSPHGDITKIDAADIPDHDILCAGFPCQAFSIGGHQRGFEDTRGTLFFDIIRIAKHHMPRVMLLENVKNLEAHDGGQTFAIMKRELMALGYKVYHKVIDASDFWVPQKRDRIFILCLREDIDVGRISWPMKGVIKYSVDDVFEEGISRPLPQTYIPERDYVGRATKVARIGRFKNGTQGYRIYDPNGLGVTLCSGGGGSGACTGLYLFDGEPRVLTARECARLTGFPESFEMHHHEKTAVRQFGNSIVVPVLSAIFRQLHFFMEREVKRHVLEKPAL